MNAISVLFGGNLSGEAFEPLFNGKNSVSLSVEQARTFPGVQKTVLLVSNGDFSFLGGVEIEQAPAPWTKRSLLETIAKRGEGFDCVYFAFADCPFLDPALAGAIADRHLRYAAEYSYADGWPYGIAPETLSPGTAAILANISGEDGPVERDILFSVIQKDINAFDIETEISAVDLRCHRLNLCADSKRSLLLLSNFITAGGGNLSAAAGVERIIAEQPQILRTLPAFYPIQVSGGCPQKCALCPYPLFTDSTGRRDFMDTGRFKELLEKIVAFSGDAVIDLSLWGEVSLHPEKMKLIEAVLSYRELALIIETSGIGWKTQELEECAELSRKAQTGKNLPPPLSWIVSLDTSDPKRYAELRGSGYGEAEACAKKLLSLCAKDCYVQAVRIAGAEDDTERFYRYWKEAAPCGEKNIIIQKFDDFCGVMERKQASDISPVIRQSCWHIMRDMPVLIDGNVPLCREELKLLGNQHGENSRSLGNVFTDSLENIWQNGTPHYIEHCKKNYTESCANCDEYYTYNF